MILILKARTGLTAQKKTVTRGGKTFQQTIWVRTDKKKKKDPEMDKMMESQKNMVAGANIEYTNNKGTKLSATIKKVDYDNSMVITSNGKEVHMSDISYVKAPSKSGSFGKVNTSNPAFSGSTTIENDKYVIATNDEAIGNAEIELIDKKTGESEWMLPDDIKEKFKKDKAIQSFIKKYYGF